MGMTLSPELEAKVLAMSVPAKVRVSAPPRPAVHVLRIAGWHPTPLNKLVGRHPMQAHKLKADDKAQVRIEAVIQRIPPAAFRRTVSLTITLAPRQRACDPDAYWKSLLDALVGAVLLVDDSRQWCRLGSVTFDRGERRSTTITLTDEGADRCDESA